MSKRVEEQPLPALMLRAFLAVLKHIRSLIFANTLPITTHLFSKKPHSPSLAVIDTRVNRVRVRVKPNLSSAFNVERFELQFKPVAATSTASAASASAIDDYDDASGTSSTVQEEQARPLHAPDWASVGSCSTQLERTIAGLQGGSTYLLRVRASNSRGCSAWSLPLEVSTRQWPVQGGGRGPGYRWSQTCGEVTLTLQLPERLGSAEVKAVQCMLDMGRRLQVLIPTAGAASGGACSRTLLLDGELYAPVRGWQDGSTWCISAEGRYQVLSITLEKQEPARSARLHFWPCAFRGHLEIDMRALALEDGQPAAERALGGGAGAGAAGGSAGLDGDDAHGRAVAAASFS